jgi:surface polysaccharide O-acyltransferase-like enzyme
MSNLQRNNTVDIFRLIASFCIVALHIHFENIYPNLYGVISLLSRWGVPFFFLIGGYFFQKSLEKQGFLAFRKTFVRIFIIYVIVSIIYLPLTNFTFGLKSVFTGDYFHLWFLPSMLLGLCVLFLFNKFRLNNNLFVATIVLFSLLVLIGEPYSFLTKFRHLPIRSLMSIPFMLIGGYFFRVGSRITKFTLGISISLIVLGAILTLLEASVITSLTDRPFYSYEILIGSFLMSIGIFTLSFSIKSRDETMGGLGRKLSLFIYLYHPLVLFLYHQISFTSSLKNYGFLLSIPIFIITLFFGLILDKYLNRVFLLMNGTISIN